MTRKGLPGEVTFTLTPKHETERAVGTAKEAVFQAEGIARAETGPRLGFGVWGSGSWGAGRVGEPGGRGPPGCSGRSLETRARSSGFAHSACARGIIGEFKDGQR